MSIEFKIWNEINKKAQEQMSPNLGLRNWNDLNSEEKERIWHYTKKFFEGKEEEEDFGTKKLRVFLAIFKLNEIHKYRSYAKNFLITKSFLDAKRDFESIFLKEEENVVLELLSYFCEVILNERADKWLPKYNYSRRTDEEYEKINQEWRFRDFDLFKDRINDILEQFGVNIALTHQGFIPRQDKKITEDVYIPVLNFLSVKDKWEKVNQELSSAFKAYQQKTKEGYSKSITHAVGAVEAFLQILVYGKNGKGTLGALIVEAKNKGLISNDLFSEKFLGSVQSVLSKERKEKGDAHAKNTYAKEKNAQLILNLSMVFLQYCIIDK